MTTEKYKRKSLLGSFLGDRNRVNRAKKKLLVVMHSADLKKKEENDTDTDARIESELSAVHPTNTLLGDSSKM